MKGLLNLRKTEEKPETKIDDIPHPYMSSMSRTLTAFFNVHSLNKNKPLYADLVIPFDARIEDDGFASHKTGYMVSTGEISEAGSHIVKAVLVNHSGTTQEKKVAVPFQLIL